MIVVIRLEVSDDERRLMREWGGASGLATRKEVGREIDALWAAHLEAMRHDVAQEKKRTEKPELLEPDPEAEPGDRCGEESPGWGKGMRCQLPRGHEGQHRAKVERGTAAWYTGGKVWIE